MERQRDRSGTLDAERASTPRGHDQLRLRRMTEMIERSQPGGVEAIDRKGDQEFRGL